MGEELDVREVSFARPLRFLAPSRPNVVLASACRLSDPRASFSRRACRREFLHFCQLNKAVQKLEDCSVKAELIRSDFTPSVRIEYVDGQREVLDQLPPRMVDHVLSQCRLVSQGKRIWEWDGPDHYYWDDYDYDEDHLSGDGLGEGGPSSYAHSFDKELLDLVVMDDDFGEDDEG